MNIIARMFVSGRHRSGDQAGWRRVSATIAGWPLAAAIIAPADRV
jgi:hypothetical protein